MRATDVDPEDIRALLAELSDVGGHIDKEQDLLTARPASRRVGRGYVGEISTLRAGQLHTQNPGLKHNTGNMVDLLPSTTRSPISSSSPFPFMAPVGTSFQGTAEGKASPISGGSPGFSTYSNVGMGEAEQSHRSYVAPLNVRLAPLITSPGGTEEKKDGGVSSAFLSSSPGIEGKGTFSSSSPGVSPSPSVLTVNPLPALPGEAGKKGPMMIPSVEEFTTLLPSSPNKPRSASERIGDRGTGVISSPSSRGSGRSAGEGSGVVSLPPTKGGPPHLSPTTIPPNASAMAGAGSTHATSWSHVDNEVDLGHRESNFLPIMCSRYLRPAGITPPPCWGHTLTPLADTGHQLLLFGGVDLRPNSDPYSPSSFSKDNVASPPFIPKSTGHGTNNADNNNISFSSPLRSNGHSTLMMFHTNEVAWEPIPVLSGEPPAPRHSHTACGYDGHFLIVYGGQSSTDSGVIFGDIHMFDVHEHSWKCLWQCTPSTGSGRKAIPAPRYGHSMVLRHNRLYIYGGRVHRTTTTSSTSSSSNNANNGQPPQHSETGQQMSSAMPSSNLGGVGSSLTWASQHDVYVFSINTRKWKRPIHVEKSSASSAIKEKLNKPDGHQHSIKSDSSPSESSRSPLYDCCPPPRAFHAACMKGNYMYINGGEGPGGCVYNDTWCLNLANSSSRGPGALAQGAESSSNGGGSNNHTPSAVGSNQGKGMKEKEDAKSRVSAGGGKGGKVSWVCLHRGQSVDATCRSRHHLFVCGEALLAVGGCGSTSNNIAAGGAGGPKFSDRLVGKFFNFVAVLPIPSLSPSFTGSSSCFPPPSVKGEVKGGDREDSSSPVGVHAANPSFWMPVAMGNTAIVTPNKRSFGAAFCGGFIYVFGGQSGSEPATNVMIRFLAADGYTTSDLRGSREGNDQALRNVLLSLRVDEDKQAVQDHRNGAAPSLPYDAYAMTTTYGAVVAGYHDSRLLVGLHRSIVSSRAPKFWDQLLCCRHDPLRQPSSGIIGKSRIRSVRGGGDIEGKMGENRNECGVEVSGVGDALDALMMNTTLPCISPSPQASVGLSSSSAMNGTGRGNEAGPIITHDIMVYYTVGNSRVEGLSVTAHIEELRALVYYLYSGDLPKWFSGLLEDEDEDEEDLPSNLFGASSPSGGGGTNEKERIRASLQVLQQLACTYDLPMLQQMCEAYSSGKRRAVEKALRASTAALRSDLLHILDTGKGATVTVLFADPHTKEQSTHALHPAILMGASPFFSDLLRPLYWGQCTQFQIGPVAAKVTIPTKSASTSDAHTDYLGNVLSDVVNCNTGALLTSSSKRSIIVGPISISKLAVLPILRFMYCQVLDVPKALVYPTMLGANQLDLPFLRGYCESIVAREEVNYDTCCGFYYISRKYQTFLLEEMCLLTAASGYSTVRYTPGYKNLSQEDRQRIDDVAQELGSSTWAPPPAPMHELKTPETYAERWKSSSAVM